VVPDTGSGQNRENTCKINILKGCSDGVDRHGGLLRSRHDAAGGDGGQWSSFLESMGEVDNSGKAWSDVEPDRLCGNWQLPLTV
jgi:hypothetical protein